MAAFAVLPRGSGRASGWEGGRGSRCGRKGAGWKVMSGVITRASPRVVLGFEN